jgi:hypothetical protein
MAWEIDVNQLVRTYAQRNHLTRIDYRSFALAMQHQALVSKQGEPLLRELYLNPDLVLVPRLHLLANERKLSLETSGDEIRCIVLPDGCLEAVEQYYLRIDENPEIAFPEPDSLRLPIPEDLIRTLNLDSEPGASAEGRGDPLGASPVPLLRIAAPDDLPPFIIPYAFVPDRLIEYSALKLRQYLRAGGNKEFIKNRLAVTLAGKEPFVDERIFLLLTKPTDLKAELETSVDDFTFAFWSYLADAVRCDVADKRDIASLDLAARQAAHVITHYSAIYKVKAKTRLELQRVLSSLDEGLRRPPFHFSIEDTTGFVDSEGIPIEGAVDRARIEAWFREKSSVAEPGRLPEILMLPVQGRREFVARDKFLLLAVHLSIEARAKIRAIVIERWWNCAMDFQTDPAMVSDAQFRRCLSAEIAEHFPVFDTMLRSAALPLLLEESPISLSEVSGLERFHACRRSFVPDTILDLDRGLLLAEARARLPFWYSVPILAFVVRIYRLVLRGAAGARPRAEAGSRPQPEAQRGPGRTPHADGSAADLSSAAKTRIEGILPKGSSLQDQLKLLETRWNSLLVPEDRENLRKDVDSLIRDYLRTSLRMAKSESLSTERVENLSASLAACDSLAAIRNRQALEMYIRLSMLDLVGSGWRGH